MDFSKRRLTYHFTQLTQEACLKAFHKKQSLKNFISIHDPTAFGVPDYSCIETKRDYLSSIFSNLISSNRPNDHKFMYSLASSLVSMESFPDLEGWEDSSEKIVAARQAIALLRKEYSKISEIHHDEKEIAKRRESAKKQEERQKESLKTLEDIIKRLNELLPKIGTQKAGYEFEKWFFDLADYYEIQCKRPYKDSHGRQIDGSITISGTTFLIETKFTTLPSETTDIDIFLSKIHRKADNTMGVFISISGFSETAKENASRDRTPLLLMDHSHFFNIVFPRILTLDEAVERIWRHASQTGHAYLPADQF